MPLIDMYSKVCDSLDFFYSTIFKLCDSNTAFNLQLISFVSVGHSGLIHNIWLLHLTFIDNAHFRATDLLVMGSYNSWSDFGLSNDQFVLWAMIPIPRWRSTCHKSCGIFSWCGLTLADEGDKNLDLIIPLLQLSRHNPQPKKKLNWLH